MEIKKFLCCFSTREGSILCGIGTLIIGVLRIYFLWFNMSFLHRLTETQMKDLPLSLDVLSTISKIQTAVAVFTIIVAILLLVGTAKSKKKLLVPWTLWVVFEEFLDVFIIMFYIIEEVKTSPSVYIGDSVFLIINMYCVLCVYSFYKQLKQEETNQRSPYFMRNDDEQMLIPNQII